MKPVINVNDTMKPVKTRVVILQSSVRIVQEIVIVHDLQDKDSSG